MKGQTNLFRNQIISISKRLKSLKSIYDQIPVTISTEMYQNYLISIICKLAFSASFIIDVVIKLLVKSWIP